MTTGSGQPLVSILIPAFNAALYLKECLDSVLAQTYPRIEVIVLDDASTDNSGDIFNSYGSAIQVHRQRKNRGQFNNVNDGIRLAQGELIAVYHADDVYSPQIVEREAEYLLQHPEAGAVFCLDNWIDQRGSKYGRLEMPKELETETPMPFERVFNGLLENKNTFLVCPTSMVRTSIYEELGGYRQSMFLNNSDLDMWIRIAKGHSIGILQDHLMDYRHFHGSSSHRYHHLRTEAERYFVIMDYHLGQGGQLVATQSALLSYEAHRSEDQIMIAISHYIKGELREARETVRAVRLKPLVRSPRVQRVRLLTLYVGLWFLTRIPRSSVIADVFYRRWHEKKRPRGLTT